MQRSRCRAPKFRPASLKPSTKLQDAGSFCISCGSRNAVVFRQSNDNQKLIKCQNCGVISPDFCQSKPGPGVREDFSPLNKERAQEMADQILDAFTHQHTRQKLQRALAVAHGDVGLICHKYLPVASEIFAHVVSLYGFSESIEGVMESVRVMQTQAKDDEQLVQNLIAIRKLLTPTGNWIQEDKEAEKDDEHRRQLEQQALLQKAEEEHRKEFLFQENAKKARLLAKKIALGLDPSVERPPLLVAFPPPVVAATENASLDLRVNAKFVKKFQWFFNGHPIETEEFVSGINRCTLVILKLTKRVTGEYYCTCENEEGTVSSPSCRVSLAVLKLSRIGTKALGNSATSPMHLCDKSMVLTCVGSTLNLYEAKSLTPVKAFPALPTAMEALAWEPQTERVAVFSASIQREDQTKVYFYSLVRTDGGNSNAAVPTSTNRRRNRSNFGISKRKVPSIKNSLTFQLVDVQSVDVVADVHAAEFVNNGKMLLVTDMMHQVALYDLALSFTCKKTYLFGSDVVCHVAVSPKAPMLFALAFRNKPFIKLYSSSTTDKKTGQPEILEHRIDFKFPAHRASFDSSGFFSAVAESGFMKSWISIVNVITKKPSNKRFKAHAGRVSGLQWTTTSWLLVSSSYDGYIKVWDPAAMTNLLSVHVEMYGIHSMLLMEGPVLITLGYNNCRLQSRSILQLAELEASRLEEMHKQAANIQKIWKGKRTRQLIAKYIRGSEK
ncbi:Protein C10 [Phytophthora infestans]|uniref:Protein C10 n=1 Tax=Phytophthora infestans TaxID=4787 RepID=A0A833SZ84_PHYIN|nr:Protein C10 [Phytophthora infestans]